MEIVTTLGIKVVIAILTLVGAWLAGNFLKIYIGKFNRIDGTLRSFLGGLLKYSLMTVAFVMILTQFGVQTASLIAVLGAAGLAIGLALQGTLSNVAAGVMLLILRPFNVGDFITAGNISGTVKSLGLFVTELSTTDNVYIFAPNSQLWNTQVQNFSRNLQRRLDLVFGISYNDDINKAFKTIEGVLKKEKRLVDTKGKEPILFVTNLGASSVDITARFWVETGEYWQVKWDVTKAVKEALDKEGITIPFPTQTMISYSGDDEKKKEIKAPAKKKAA